VSLQHNRELPPKERTHTHPREPSAWVRRFAPLIAAGGKVLDLACGYGRHARFLEDSGWRVVAVDRDAQALAGLSGRAGIRALQADVENGDWPCGEQRFAGIVVVNYLHRPLFSRLVDALDEGGVLIYETFMSGNERFGRPSNPEFLLRLDELLDVFGQQLSVVAFEQGEVAQPKPAMLQRLCAVRTADATRLRLPEPV
jgi:SAM-dependent methyltransferase